tara:strand:- start:2048 stop:3706 length:1659 start_codon:yes stop_codon:yes gene_type:complete
MYGRSTSLPSLALARKVKTVAAVSAYSPLTDITVRANAKRDEVMGAVNAIQSQSAALAEDIQGVRERLPDQIQTYFNSLAEILHTGDTYASALGVSFGDYRDGASGGYYAYPPRGLATTPNINMLKQVHSVLQWMEDLPISLYPEVRRLIADIIESYKPLSNALWAANGAGRSILTGTVELYDTAGEINALASKWATEPIGVMATDLCTEYVTHSGYRRLRKARAPGVHAKWDEVCDLWVEDYSRDATGATWGSSFKYPRPRDPNWKAMPSPLRAGKTLLEEGCLPGEVCADNIPRAGLRTHFGSKLDVAVTVQNAINGPVVDNVFNTADAMLLNIKQLITELIRHVNGLIAGIDGHALLPEAAEDAAIGPLNDAKAVLVGYRSMVQDFRNEGASTKALWRGSAFATGWRTSINPYVLGSVAAARDLKASLNSPSLVATCDFIFPQKGTSWHPDAMRERADYWEFQGVPSRCYAPTGGFSPTPRKIDIPRPPRGPRGQKTFDFDDGGDTSGLPTHQLGAVQPNQPPKRYFGLLPWQALTLIAGVWMLWPEKK